MNALRILFNTGRFNLSKVGEHFINPCCFGEDLSAWLRQKLIERLVEMREPYQEDWSWELPAKSGDQSYYLCMSGNADGSAANPDEGEWGNHYREETIHLATHKEQRKNHVGRWYGTPGKRDP